MFNLFALRQAQRDSPADFRVAFKNIQGVTSWCRSPARDKQAVGEKSIEVPQ